MNYYSEFLFSGRSQAALLLDPSPPAALPQPLTFVTGRGQAPGRIH